MIASGLPHLVHLQVQGNQIYCYAYAIVITRPGEYARSNISQVENWLTCILHYFVFIKPQVGRSKRSDIQTGMCHGNRTSRVWL